MTAPTPQRRGERPDQALLHCGVLVADDDSTNRLLIGHILERQGFTNVRMAVDGSDVLNQLNASPPDILILDIVMPKLDGFAVCARLRADPRFADLPILVQTALDRAEDRAKAFRCGATDLVTKPINAEELGARISIHLERRLFIESLSEYQRRTQEELLLARDMQRDMLPSAATLAGIGSRYGVDVAGYASPCSEIGGDLWGVGDIDSARFGLYALDFSGHGVAAALNTFRIQTLITELWGLAGDPSMFLQNLGERLNRMLSPGQFATMFHAVMDIGKRRLDFAAAGSPPPALIAGAESCLLDGSGLPLGILPDTSYPGCSVAMPPGATLLLASDAIVDAPDPQGTGLLPAAFLSLARHAAQKADAAAAAAIIVGEFERRQVGPAADDLTVVCLRC